MPDAGLLAEEKLDGWRAVYLRDHEGRPRLWTRNGHPIEGAGHILWRLEQMERAAGCEMMFDGEFQVDGTLAATKRWCESGWKAGGEAGQFFAFDCMPIAEWRAGGSDRPLIERKAMLTRLFAAAEGDGWDWRPRSHGRDEALPPVEMVQDEWAFDAADVEHLVRRVWAREGEGIMLKDAEAPYTRNRSNAWLKVKHLRQVRR